MKMTNKKTLILQCYFLFIISEKKIPITCCLFCFFLPAPYPGFQAVYFMNFQGLSSIKFCVYWVPQKLPKIYTVIAYICIGKVA